MPLAKHGGIVSGRPFICLAAVLWLSDPASAGCISQTFGNITFHNCDGKMGTSQTFGNTTVHNFDGTLGPSQTIDPTTVHNFDGALRTQALLVSLKERRLYIVPFFAHLRGGIA